MRVYLFVSVFFLPRGDRIDSVVLERRESILTKIKSSSALFK